MLPLETQDKLKVMETVLDSAEDRNAIVAERLDFPVRRLDFFFVSPVPLRSTYGGDAWSGLSANACVQCMQSTNEATAL